MKAMELGATRAQALGLARRLTGSNRSSRNFLLLNGEMDRARADVDALVDALFTGKSANTGAAGHRRTRLCRDVRAGGPAEGAEISHLAWRDAYGCGELTIDDQHHKLFNLANDLIDTSLTSRHSTHRVASAVGRLLEHVTQHFVDEEAWLATRRYAMLQAHRAAHASLLFRATQLRARVGLKSSDVGEFVSFLANEVVAKHMLAADRDYYSLVAQDRGVSPIGPMLP
jgi:hemerythrin-like metal-binding protein